jgi:hypothetical protein
MEQDNTIEDSEFPEQRDVSAARNVPGLFHPTWKSKRQAEQQLGTVNAIEMRRSKGVKQKKNRMDQCFTSFLMYLDQ